MSDLAKYVKARAVRDPEFAEGLELGYTDFKVGALLRQAREKAGLTQEQVADRLETKKSAISRIFGLPPRMNRAGRLAILHALPDTEPAG